MQVQTGEQKRGYSRFWFYLVTYYTKANWKKIQRILLFPNLGDCTGTFFPPGANPATATDNGRPQPLR